MLTRIRISNGVPSHVNDRSYQVRRLPRWSKVLMVLVAFVITNGIDTHATASNNDERIDVVAVVNGSPISRSDLANECLSRFGEEVLESLVNRQLIVNESHRHNIQVTQEEIDDEITIEAGKWGISSERWIQLLKEERNINEQKYREYIWTTLMLKKLAAERITVSAEEVDQILESEVGPKVQARLITTNTREKADEVLQLVLADPESFGRVAREHSTDNNSRANSGLIPPIRRYSGSPALEEVAFALQPGEISQVMEIEGQFVIIRCESILPAMQISPPQEQTARTRIIEHLANQKLADSAGGIFEQLQSTVTITNVYNDVNLQPQYPDVAAFVDNTRIGLNDLAEECITRHGVEILDGEIHRTLLLQEINRYGFEITEEDIHSEIGRAAESMGYVTEDGAANIDAWLEYVVEHDAVTVEQYIRDMVWPSVALKLLVHGQVEVTEEDIEKAWEANFGPRVEALAIVLQDERKANEVWHMAMQNRTPQFFGELAHTYSTEPASQANYGRIPPIERYGGRQRLEEEAFMLQPGDISGITQIAEHYIILYCLGHTEPVVTDRNDPVIRQELYNDIFEKKQRLAMAQKFSVILENAQIDNFLLGTTQTPQTNRSASIPTNQGGRVPFAPSGLRR